VVCDYFQFHRRYVSEIIQSGLQAISDLRSHEMFYSEERYLCEVWHCSIDTFYVPQEQRKVERMQRCRGFFLVSEKKLRSTFQKRLENAVYVWIT